VSELVGCSTVGVAAMPYAGLGKVRGVSLRGAMRGMRLLVSDFL